MTKAEAKNSSNKAITIEESPEDIAEVKKPSDMDDFSTQIKKEAKKNSVVTRLIIPLIAFLFVAGVSGAATYYYSKPQRSAESNITTEDKIQTPPTVNSTTENPDTPVSNEKPVEEPKQTTSTTSPESKVVSYTVQEGDTMSGIANKYNMTSTELAKYNGLSNKDSLQIGQVLKIPVQ